MSKPDSVAHQIPNDTSRNIEAQYVTVPMKDNLKDELGLPAGDPTPLVQSSRPIEGDMDGSVHRTNCRATSAALPGPAVTSAQGADGVRGL